MTSGLALLLMLCGTGVETAHAQDGAHGDVVNGDTLDLGGASKADVSALEGNVMLNSTGPLSATLQGNISTRVNLFEEPACLWSYATVAVSEDGQAVEGLDEDDFDVQEDGSAVCDYFVSQAGTQGGTAQADFVFAVDNSGSMGGDQTAIDNALAAFATALDNSGIDFRIGLTRYGQSSTGCARSRGGAPIWEDNCNATFYSDAIFYRDNIWTQNIAFGGNEPGYEAIVETVNRFPWRPSAQKIVIIVTDESLAQDTFVADANDALTALNSLGATLYGVTTSSQQSQVRALSDPTGGDWFQLRVDPWTTILNDITTQIASLYTIGFRPCDDAVMAPPMSRNVDITVNSGGNSATINTSYTPGERPQGRRTTATAAITNAPAGTDLTLQLDIRDFVGTSVSSAELFYRTTGGTSYTSVAMTDLGGGTFEGTIPGADVAEPGVDYYFQYSDGTGIFTTPVDDPVANPFQIGVGANSAPGIVHTKPTTLTNGTAVPISAQVTDDGSLANVELFYRQQGRIGYQGAAMSNTSGDTYGANIPGSAVTDAGLDYYIAATDDEGVTRTFGTPDFPVVLGGCSPVGSCDLPSLDTKDQVDFDARTVSNTFRDQDGIQEFTFTRLENFNVTSIVPSGFTESGGIWTWSGTGAPPTAVDFTLTAPADGQAVYYLKVTDACAIPGPNTADIDPPYDFKLNRALQFALDGSYPNPTRGASTLGFTLDEAGPVTLSVYDMMGRRVATLVDGLKQSGQHEVRWDGSTDRGTTVASGVYLLRLEAGERVATQRMTVVR
ncbi:MAG: T9SS type A sorting domain-containing protein [Bacteroidetes bacterium]|jgi:hypothetical protein|nr:T9SS type A sorting domain-containing protein [Bacteroidota bacterium]